jgi:hypothetical protein
VVLIQTIAAVAALLLAVYLVFVPHIEKDMRSDLKQDILATISEKGLNDLPQQISGLKSSVEAMRHDLDLLLQKQLKIVSSLPQGNFNRNLDVIATQLRLATQRNATIDRQTIGDIRQRLLAAPAKKSGSYWNAIGQWVTYRSKSNAGQKAKVDLSSLPGCLSSGISGISSLTFDANFGCVMVLDGRQWSDVVIRNAIVIYRGGEVFLHNVELKNCYFLIDLRPQAPAPSGQNLIRQLLASDTSKTSFNITG